MAKGLGWCAGVGTFFSAIDSARNPSVGNLTSVCVFGFASWALLKSALLIKQPSFTKVTANPVEDTVAARRFGAPSWIRPAIWIGLFLVMIGMFAGIFRFRSALHLSGGGTQLTFMAVLTLYLFSCQRLERAARVYLRRWYPDLPLVALGARGLWITETEIPWTAIRSISRQTRRLKVMNVETIVVEAQAAKRTERIEIDLSDSVDDPQALYAKVRSAASAHGATLLPEGKKWGQQRIADSRARARAARQKYEEWRSSLPQEIAKTEARLKDVIVGIAESEAKIRKLEAGALTSPTDHNERLELQLEQARNLLRARIKLRDSTVKLLTTQKNALAK